MEYVWTIPCVGDCAYLGEVVDVIIHGDNKALTYGFVVAISLLYVYQVRKLYYLVSSSRGCVGYSHLIVKYEAVKVEEGERHWYQPLQEYRMEWFDGWFLVQ